jgi:Protein of unknown function (DUF2934)
MSDLPEQAIGTGMPDISAEHRLTMIAEAAYYRAQSRGFAPGGELDDWLEAEWSVDEHLAERAFEARDAAD